MQQVNLYDALTKPNPYAVDAKKAKLILLGFLLLLIVMTVLQLLWIMGKKVHLQYLQSKQQSTMQILQRLETSSPNILAQSKLQTAMAEEAKAIAYQQQIIPLLSTPPVKLSTNLQAFAQAMNPKVWLIDISIQDQGKRIALQGSALNANYLMDFIKSLQQQPALMGTEFKTVQIVNDAVNKHINFSLDTKSAQ